MVSLKSPSSVECDDKDDLNFVFLQGDLVFARVMRIRDNGHDLVRF